MTEESAAVPNMPGCVIATGTVLPEMARVRTLVDDVMREHRHYDDRMSRLHLQVDDGSRRLDRLERLVETQTQESHSLSKRIDQIDGKVSSIANGMEVISSWMSDMRDSQRSLLTAFTDHGIKADEQHLKRVKLSRTLWVVLFGILGVLSVLHFGATGSTPLQSIMTWLGTVTP